ncbi:uncharacterized protein Z518_08073 [Rhinocladiella mackenziei CBS 650.93]|uniref:Fungal-type protein kinase domain-containing protein n=1 Tax=Rhinocladiella mackenziei CBS 650.93 TaxID=1442369 RepID=A0A0D2I8E5_9EURO|nr:uncharacterized protein Z518_08073 [Rhinocladiella mackenziei CBS 650.93]KIX02134.1 hypothetical protein Z518_08073 [Rhinocladiella mackenziei CBS 650.93]
MNPPAAPLSRPRRPAAQKALNMIHNTYSVGTKRPRNTSTHQTNKAQKRKRDHTPSQPPSQEDIVYVDEIEHRILAEARGITRKNIPYDTFRSTFLSRFKHKDKRPQLNIQDIKNVGVGKWEQNSFFQRLQQALPKKVLKGLSLSSSFSKTLPGSKQSKEPLSQPDFFFHLGTGAGWAHVELVFEHTQSPVQKASEKFLQWLRSAWNVFYHQPLRHYLYGVLFLKSYALITYVDHGCAGYSEPLDFVKKPEHTQFLADFLADFIADPEHRGRDPHVTAHQQDGSIFIEYAGIKWAEVPDSLLCYRPCVFGRHLRVTRVHPADSPNDKWVMKDAWEEKVEHPSPPPEEEVISILVEANVRGIPQLHESCRSTTEGSDNVEASGDNMEVLTSEFPPNCENALAAVTKQAMRAVEPSFVSGRTSKSRSFIVPTDTTGRELLQQAKGKRKRFSECTDVRRRRARLIISYCQPLKEAMRNARPKELMRTIRDAMIVYYEAYKRPEHGFLHGDISIENIMVPVKETQLTGGLTHKTLRGTLIDWNLCFTTDGRASSRNIRSGTVAFMAPRLLLDKPVARRTLGHDMESFFAVMLWVASLDYDDEIAFQNKPLVELMIDTKSPTKLIAGTKLLLFSNPDTFDESIIDHLEEPYREDDDFIDCIWDLQTILYERTYDKNVLRHNRKRHKTRRPTNPKKKDDDDDPMEERFNPDTFDESIIDHLEEPYREDDDFIDCIWDLQTILYERTYDKNVLRHNRKRHKTRRPTNPKKKDDDDDPMEERLFKDCMAVFDKCLGDEGKQSGTYQLNKIDAGEDPEESEESFDTDSAVEDPSDSTDLTESESDDTN